MLVILFGSVKFCKKLGSSLFDAIQLGLWFTSVFSSGSVWVGNGSMVNVISMVTKNVGSVHLHYPCFCYFVTRERSGSVVECLTRDREAAGSSLTGVTALWSLSKTHLS